MSLRFLDVSNAPWCGTGFGTQIAQLGERQHRGGHKVAFFANYGLGGRKTEWNGFRVYPSALDPNGNDLIHGHADHWKADVVLVLYDAFALDPRILRQMKQHIMVWQPVDCERMGRADLEAFRISGAQPVAMSRFGWQMMADEGLDPLYAPHGIDTEHIFVPAEQILWGQSAGERRQLARAALREKHGHPEDAFLLGMNVHNKDAERKSVFEQLTAFALFRRTHKDALLLCHTLPHPVMSGNDLIGMADYLGIGKAVRWADPYSLLAGDYSQEDMAEWYAMLDAYTGASRGEGFGVPLIEAQACGVPVITTDASAMAELAGPGWLVSGQPHWQRGHRSGWTTPDIGELVAAYENAYDEAGASPGAVRSDAARAFGMEYNADVIYAAHWKPIFTELDNVLGEAE